MRQPRLRARALASSCRTVTWRFDSLSPNGPPPTEVHAALEERVRGSHGRLIAALTRRFGVQRFESIENAVQEAYLRALERWSRDGVPEEPERWLVRVAHNVL